MFLRNDKQKIVTDGNPYLCEHGILGSSIEFLYVQMLLYPFEKQLICHLSLYNSAMVNALSLKLLVRKR